VQKQLSGKRGLIVHWHCAFLLTNGLYRLAAEKTAGRRWQVRFVATELAHDNIRHSNEVIIVYCRIPPGSGDTVTFVNAALPEGSFSFLIRPQLRSKKEIPSPPFHFPV
jgi:hypothetical protein